MEEKNFLDTYNTPMYVFDAGVLKKRVNYLKEMLPDNVSLCYAIKANNFIVKELNDIIDRFEVCSPGELSVCRELDVPTEKIIFSGVYKTPSVIYELMEEDVPMGIYSIESMVQYKLLMEAASKYGRSITVMPRLTSGNQFGMTKDEVKTIIAEVKEMPNVTVEGIQFFSGTQKNSLKKLKRELTKLDEFIQVLKDELDYVPNELEFGPGFPVTYFKDEEFDEDEFLKGFSEIINEMNFKSKITLELGRSIAACCGTYYTSVVDMKSNKGQNYAIVDGGMNHLVYFGQSMAMKHPMCSVLPERGEENTVDWNICGSLCTANDILVKQLPIKDLQLSDVIKFEKTGAYCMIEGISLFLSRDLPSVFIKNEDGTYKSVRDALPTYPLNTPNY
ncbi:MAG: alanine racemase [Lachnospiraceae bacterium]|nr:alanine racemase [Lachnospiraceae bacterium]